MTVSLIFIMWLCGQYCHSCAPLLPLCMKKTHGGADKHAGIVNTMSSHYDKPVVLDGVRAATCT